ncbi:MAG: hypothetical protein LBQ82_02265 [Treponema sp.]|jgi:hypothetical protein|nr:hypothetical protein [Treponema sp.]
MKIKSVYSVFAAALVLLSCASTQDAGERAQTKRRENLLPLSTGWYQYDFERTFKGIEDEYNLALSTGIKMVQELTWKYTGVVTNFADGTLYDPVTGIELLIDNGGRISCAENVSIKGTLNKDGSFYWSGLREEHGRLNNIFVKGTLTPLPASVRGGREFDGVYHMTDSGTGRQQLVKISGGFYTWDYLDKEERGFNPWPTLIQPDGSFSFSMDMTTVMEMGSISRMNYSTGFLIEGKVIPGQGISMEEITRSSGQGIDQGGTPQIYSGTAIRSGEFPNEAIPQDIENIVRKGRSAAQAAPKPNRTNYPSWYLNLPVKTGFMYAVGEKTFDVKETAIAMAEAAAAANLADQIMVRIESEIVEVATNTGARSDERIRSEALQRLNYRIVEQIYNEGTRTAFVLLEMAVD